MTNSFKDKIVLITGAASGIGQATALAFAREGAKVVAVDIDAKAGQETVNMIKSANGEASFIEADVSFAVEIRKLIETVVDQYGRLDCLVNNAGIEGEMANLADGSEENWDRVISINLKGVWLGMKYAIPVMLQQGGGAIVNVASIAGLVGFRGLAAYNASKGGIIQLTKTAALEYADKNLRVNAVCPGVIRTPMVDRVTGGNLEMEKQFIALEPIGRMGLPAEIAESILWLCSPAASFVTGHAMIVDGGLTAQ